jgi:hypothetical protein
VALLPTIVAALPIYRICSERLGGAQLPSNRCAQSFNQHERPYRRKACGGLRTDINGNAELCSDAAKQNMYVGMQKCYTGTIKFDLRRAYENGLLSYCRNASKRYFYRAFWPALDEVFRTVVRSISANAQHAEDGGYRV